MKRLDINIIDTHTNFTLAIADVSVYDNVPVTNATIEIIPPGFNKVSLPFQPRAMNVYNSNDIGITCTADPSQLVELPDGFWQLTYSINPNLTTFINYGYMRVNNLQCRLDNALLKTLNSKDLEKIQQERALLDIQILIDGSIAAANNLDQGTSLKMYKKASDLVDKFNNQKCNHCGNMY